MDLQLTDHVAVVTGAASGIGRATAELFIAEGAKTVLWDAAETVSDVAGEIGATLALRVDVTDMDRVQTALHETRDCLGTIDHLVHAAATGSGSYGYPFTNISPDTWRRCLEVNVMGMTHIAHAIAPTMVERQSGTFVFIASVAGQIGSQTDPPYSATKAANINFAQCMARDLAPHGIRVNTVCPGMIRTPLNESVWRAWNEQQPPDQRRSYDDWAGDKVRQVIPLRRWQTAEDVANMVVFLSSQAARNVTGQTINVDGGFVMHW